MSRSNCEDCDCQQSDYYLEFIPEEPGTLDYFHVCWLCLTLRLQSLAPSQVREVRSLHSQPADHDPEFLAALAAEEAVEAMLLRYQPGQRVVCGNSVPGGTR
jgi:hypothetical protein